MFAHCIVLDCIVLCDIVMYCITLHYDVFCSIALYFIALNCFALYCIVSPVLHCIALFFIVLYRASLLYCICRS